MDTWKYDVPTWYPEDQASPYMGNGFIGGNIPLDGHGAGGMRYLATLACYYIGTKETMIPIPHWINVPLKVNGQTVNACFDAYRQALDLEKGALFTSYQDSNRCVRVETETFCHRGQRSVAPYRLSVRALKDVDVELEPRFDCAQAYYKPVSAQVEAGKKDVTGWTLDFNDKSELLAQLLATQFSNGSARASRSEWSVGKKFSTRLKAGQTCELIGITVTCHGPAPMAAAREIMTNARKMGYAALKASHVREWKALWKNFHVEADDPYLERKMRSAMFYLLCGYRKDVAWGGIATGLSSKLSWGGCVFWDTEFYMFPAILAFHPDQARSILQYRYNTLAGARQNAVEYGEKGARFPWQSHKTGHALYKDGFENERHVGADIAYAAWWYSQCTGDETFLQKEGREIILGVARNCVSKITLNKKKKRYEIHGVVPSDEHVLDHYVCKPINNSVFFNAYVKWLLQKAVELYPDRFTAEERKQWLDMARRMYLPRDEKRKIYLEYDGYNGHPIKQADVGHLFFPLCVSRNAAEIKRNIYYYAERDRATQLYLLHSPPVYAAALSRAGDVKGVTHFLRLSDRNTVGPFELPRESNYGGGVCITGSGAFLDIVIYGLLGIENSGEELTAHPCLSKDVGRIKISGLFFKGKRYSVEAKPGGKAKIAVVE